MSQDIIPRGQKRNLEDGQGPSSHSHKRPREGDDPDPHPNAELYWVVQWYALAETLILL